MSFDAGVNKANNLLDESQAASLNAQNLTMAITETIDHLSNNVSKQIMKTHEVAKDQIEADMKAQGVLATHQKDVSFFFIRKFPFLSFVFVKTNFSYVVNTVK